MMLRRSLSFASPYALRQSAGQRAAQHLAMTRIVAATEYDGPGRHPGHWVANTTRAVCRSRQRQRADRSPTLAGESRNLPGML